MFATEYLKKALWHHHYPLVALACCVFHLNKGKIPMSEVSIIPGSKSTVHIAGLDSLGQEIALTSPVSASVDDTAIASIVERPDLTNAFDVVGVAVGTATITAVSGGLTLSIPVIVSADVPASLTATVNAPVLDTPATA